MLRFFVPAIEAIITLPLISKSKRVTQSELAERVNMSVVTIAYIETGKRWVRLSTLDKIAKSLGVPISELLKGL
ncbi:MAG TPA: helix-turn-helix transcriptional regulator [Candidatus Saccharimonadales bacterium]